MATPKQIAANRRNARKSTGPNTSEGKQIVAKNAVRHGLLSTNPIVSAEEQEEFNQFAAAMEDEYQPQGLREGLLISRIADLHWRLRRVSHVETGMFVLNRRKEMKVQSPPDPNAAEESAPWSESPNPQAASIAGAYTRHAGAFARLSRHERQIERSLQQAMDQLNRLQYARDVDIHPFYVDHMRRFPGIDTSKPKEKDEGHYRCGPPRPRSDHPTWLLAEEETEKRRQSIAPSTHSGLGIAGSPVDVGDCMEPPE